MLPEDNFSAFSPRYRHQVELVRFLNQFADPQMDMPAGWDKKVDQSGRVSLWSYLCVGGLIFCHYGFISYEYRQRKEIRKPTDSVHLAKSHKPKLIGRLPQQLIRFPAFPTRNSTPLGQVHTSIIQPVAYSITPVQSPLGLVIAHVYVFYVVSVVFHWSLFSNNDLHRSTPSRGRDSSKTKPLGNWGTFL